MTSALIWVAPKPYIYGCNGMVRHGRCPRPPNIVRVLKPRGRDRKPRIIGKWVIGRQNRPYAIRALSPVTTNCASVSCHRPNCEPMRHRFRHQLHLSPNREPRTYNYKCWYRKFGATQFLVVLSNDYKLITLKLSAFEPSAKEKCGPFQFDRSVDRFLQAYPKRIRVGILSALCRANGIPNAMMFGCGHTCTHI